MIVLIQLICRFLLSFLLLYFIFSCRFVYFSFSLSLYSQFNIPLYSFSFACLCPFCFFSILYLQENKIKKKEEKKIDFFSHMATHSRINLFVLSRVSFFGIFLYTIHLHDQNLCSSFFLSLNPVFTLSLEICFIVTYE